MEGSYKNLVSPVLQSLLVCDKRMEGSYKTPCVYRYSSQLVCDKRMEGSYKELRKHSAPRCLVCDKRMEGSYKDIGTLGSSSNLYVTREWRVVTRLNLLKSDEKNMYLTWTFINSNNNSVYIWIYS